MENTLKRLHIRHTLFQPIHPRSNVGKYGHLILILLQYKRYHLPYVGIHLRLVITV